MYSDLRWAEAQLPSSNLCCAAGLDISLLQAAFRIGGWARAVWSSGVGGGI